ncbi:MAG: hypothetical protein HYY62_03375 [Deltaproteobacteria bacterium]|nr:hypothetical protein [Deltaproteobacteria bacterium]
MSQLKSKNPRPKNEGQALIESLFILPLFLALLFFAIQISFVTISKRLVTWACFTLTRELLPLSPPHTPPKSMPYASAYRILSKIPFKKMPPFIEAHDFKTEVSVTISQTIYLWNIPHDLKNKITLYR